FSFFATSKLQFFFVSLVIFYPFLKPGQGCETTVVFLSAMNLLGIRSFLAKMDSSVPIFFA
ncbi:hypothetical protein, partial [Parabacteroides johnsonii]|uniref:hypothetical protein n=1 Tax=Parabacteroides johnsonii TaxID=387661 RepID=UPI001E425405